MKKELEQDQQKVPISKENRDRAIKVLAKAFLEAIRQNKLQKINTDIEK
jgi:hypothetical protein